MIIKTKLVGWEQINKVFGESVLREHLDRVGNETLRLASAEAVKAIKDQFSRNGIYTPNAPLTREIKGNDNALVDSGAVRDGVVDINVKQHVVWVGVPRDASRTRHWIQALSAFDAATVLHNGKSIRVTEKMRSMFFMLYLVKIGQLEPSALTGRAAELYSRGPVDWRPLKPSKRVIRIPKRPFLYHALNRSGLKKRCRAIFKAAVKKYLVAPTVAEVKKARGIP